MNAQCVWRDKGDDAVRCRDLSPITSQLRLFGCDKTTSPNNGQLTGGNENYFRNSGSLSSGTFNDN